MSMTRMPIGKIIAQIAQKNSDRDALVHTEAGRRYSYRDLSHAIDQAARGFLSLGIGSGDRIALWSTNAPEWMVSFLGLAKIGAITVPIDPAAAKDNLHYILEQSESCGLIVAEGSNSNNMLAEASAAQNDIACLEHVIVLNHTAGRDQTSWKDLIAAGEQISRIIAF